MNIAIINQNNSKYLFEVPESITLKEGEKVKCDTRRGVTDGIVWADSITADEPAAKLIGKLLGAKFPLKSVVGKTVTSVEMFEQPEPKQEPVKLYCVEDYSPGVWVTKGKVYEIDKCGKIRFDDGYSMVFEDMPKPNSMTDPLFPLVSRPAKVGEWVYINDNAIGTAGMHKGKVVKITSIKDGGYSFFNPDDDPAYDANLMLKEYLVLDGYTPEPEKAEPEYLNMRVVCVESHDDFTVGKVYEFADGKVRDDSGVPRLSSSFKAKTLDEWNRRFGGSRAKFIEFKGE